MSDSEFKNKVEAVLDSVRPYLEEDGGGVEFVNWEPDNRVLEVKLTGACDGCPMALMTLRAGIERILISRIPEIKRIENVR